MVTSDTSLPERTQIPYSEEQENIMCHEVTNTTNRRTNIIKSVRFSEDDPEIIRSAFVDDVHNIHSDYDVKDFHWQERDYQIFMRTARLIAVEIRKLSVPRKPYDYEDVLTRTLAACEDNVSILSQSIDPSRRNKSCCNSIPECGISDLGLQPKLLLALSNWVQVGSSRRGLEKLISPFHAKRRNLARQAAITAVLDIQKQLTMTDTSDVHLDGEKFSHDSIATSDLQMIIRSVSEYHTRSARLYALVMGHADAMAAGYMKDQLSELGNHDLSFQFNLSNIM